MPDLSFSIYENIALQNLRDQYTIELASELNDLIVKLKTLAQARQPLTMERGDQLAIRSVIRDLADNHLKLRYFVQWIDLSETDQNQVVLETTKQILTIVLQQYPTLTENDIYVMGPILVEANFLNYTTNKPATQNA